jgi:DNA-binding CsgD family transcriptional regulator
MLERVLIVLRCTKLKKEKMLDLKTNEFNEILYRLGRLEKAVIEIKTMLTRPTNMVSTSEVPRNGHGGNMKADSVQLISTEQLTESQLAILNEVRSSKVGITAEDIQDRLGYRSRATVSHNLNDLFKLGLLNKKRGKNALYSID